jgi:hypothetical protein
MTPRRTLYAEVLSKVRHVMISRMAKPEEAIFLNKFFSLCHASNANQLDK